MIVVAGHLTIDPAQCDTAVDTIGGCVRGPAEVVRYDVARSQPLF